MPVHLSSKRNLDFFLLLSVRTICAFLNTGKGGIVYMGILDSGVVNGLHLTKYQVRLPLFLRIPTHFGD